MAEYIDHEAAMDVREKLVELLGSVYLPMMDGSNTVGEYTIPHKFKEKIADHLISNGVTVQKWISVDERLPEPGEHVLVTDGGFVGEFYINRRGQWQRCNVNNYFLLTALDILWWMPLPEPPKGE